MSLQFPKSREIEEWQLFVWNLPEDFVNPAQKLHLMLMLEGSFNAFDAMVVVRALLENRASWQAVLMDRGCVSGHSLGKHSPPRLISDLIKLRDLPDGGWNVETVFILTGAEQVAVVEKMVEGWQADEVTILSAQESDELMGTYRSDHPQRIVTVWWD